MSAEPRETWYAWQDGSGYWRPRMLTGSGSSVERAVESQEDAEYWAEVLNRHDSTVYLLGCSLQRSADDVKSLSAQVATLTAERDAYKAALSDTYNELAHWAQGEDCDHSVGICMCSTKRALEAARAALEGGRP